jgi:hypothetical protein
MFVSQIYEECAEILGTTNSEKVFRKISQAVQTLMESGHWSHSTAEIDICTGWDGQSVTLPRGVDTPLAINVDGSPVYFRNRLFQYHVNKGGKFNPVSWAWDDRGYTPTMMEIREPSQLIAIAETENDVGKQIRVIGINGNNVPLRCQLENGTALDGLLVSIHSMKDFPYGTILPDDQTVETRLVSIDPITKFVNDNGQPHQLDSGEGMNIQNESGVIPIPLYNGQVAYVGILDAITIQLFNDQINAVNGNFPIEMESIVSAGTIKIKDSKPSQVVTAINMYSPVPVPVTTGNPVAFPDTIALLPSPLEKKVTYFANLISNTELDIFESYEDAQNNINPIYVQGPSGIPFPIDIRKELLPETKLTFAIPHYFLQGDQIQCYTAGGTLPNPLIPNQNYFVNVVDPLTITIHETQADAIASSTTNFINPIKIIDAGSGTNYIVKLLSSTFRSGETSQITASGLNIAPPTGSGASFQAVVTGSVRAVQVTAQGNGYATVPGVTFSEPPDPPIGSGQQAEIATGYAIINTFNTKLEQIIITNPGFGYTSPPAITIDPPTGASPQQATASATIQTSFVSYFRKVSGGNNYTQAPQVQITGGGGSGATAQAVVNNTVFNISSISVVGTTATATTSVAHGFNRGSIVTIKNASPSVFLGDKTVLSVPQQNTNITSITRAGTTATVTTAVNHNYSTGQIVTISGVTEVQYNGDYSITVLNSTQFTYVVTGNPTTPAGGASKIASIPLPSGNTFTFTVPSGTTDATIGGTVVSGEVIALNIITSGTGYTSAPSVILTPSTGVFIEFTSTGTLPSPLVAGTAYRAEAPLDTNAGVFTVRNADFSKVNITGGGSGTFYTVLSRSFGVDFTDRWLGDFKNLTTGQEIYFGTDFILPSTSPAIDGSNPFTLEVISPTVAKIKNTALPPVYIQVIAFGVGQSYYGIRRQCTISIPENTIKPDSVRYLQEDEIVRFNTSGSLPAPLIAGVDYKVKIVGDAVRVYTTAGGLITLNSTGEGELTLDIQRSIRPLPSTSIRCEKSLYETGQSINVRAAKDDVLPSGLSAGVSYFVRVISENAIELYDTEANAKGSGTTGRIEYRTPGKTTGSQFYIDAIDDEVLVKTIHQIEKPLTDGFVSLYAWDFGRSNDMTLIGQYHPSEINPQYRRIRVGVPSAWVRLAYRMSPPFITSKYDYIPIEHERAIIAAIHAVDMEDKDFADQSARYWGIAFNYLRNQQEYIDGHAMTTPQINNITYGDGTDWVIN